MHTETISDVYRGCYQISWDKRKAAQPSDFISKADNTIDSLSSYNLSMDDDTSPLLHIYLMDNSYDHNP